MFAGGKPRFTLYCLEDGEEHVSDVLATYTCGQWSFRGTLRLGTRSLFMDPDDLAEPVVKIPFKDIVGLGIENETIIVACKTVITMLKNGRVNPYVQEGTAGRHEIKLQWDNPAALHTKLQDLIAKHRNGEEVVIPRAPFDYSWLSSVTENALIEAQVFKHIPLKRIRAHLVLTEKALYVQLHESLEAQPLCKIAFVDVGSCARRQILFRNVAIEVQTDPEVLLLVFDDEATCDQYWTELTKQPVPVLQTSTIERLMRRWVNGGMSNYDYLMNLNWAAGRSLNDLSQYPVMPWVLADYTSSELDLSNPLTFRDLSKPVGALNPHRLDSFRQRMEETKSLGDEASAYLYATHYSNPSYVLYYLLRQHPEWMLLIHKGKFDKGDRLFNSVAACWNNVLNLPNDVKELIPQFYNGDGSWLGSKGLELGLLDDGTKVPDNVVLPPWATSMADFVKKNREALESEHVSANLHGWIDLIFGHASRGEPAVDHDNVFHPLTYGQSAEPMSPAESEQVREFGQCPIQLFGKRHPSRRVTTAAPAYAELSAALQPRTDYCEDDDSAYPDNADDFKLITMGSSYVLEDLPSADAAIEDISALGIGGNLSFNSPPPRIDSSLVVHEEASVNLPAESSLLEPMRFRAVLEARCMKKSASGVTTASFDTVPEWLAKCMQLAFEEDMIGTGVTFDASHLDAAFVTGESGQLPVMDLTNGTRLRTLQLGSQKLTSVAVVPRDPTVLFVGSQDNHVYCYNLADGKLEDRIQAHEASVTAMRLHSDGVRLATGGEDGSVKIWKVEDFGLRISDSFNEHQSQVSAVAWCNDATWLASCGDDSVLVYDTKCPQAGVLFRADVEDCLQVQFVDNSPTVVVMTSQAVQVMDLRTNTVMWQQAEQNPFVPGTLYWGPATTWAASTSRLLGFDSSNGALVTKHSVAAGSTVQGLALLATDALPKFVLVAQAASKYTTTAVLSSATGSY